MSPQEDEDPASVGVWVNQLESEAARQPLDRRSGAAATALPYPRGLGRKRAYPPRKPKGMCGVLASVIYVMMLATQGCSKSQSDVAPVSSGTPVAPNVSSRTSASLAVNPRIGPARDSETPPSTGEDAAPSVILSHQQGADDDSGENSDDDDGLPIPQYDVNSYCARFGKAQPGEYPDQIERGHQVLLYCLHVGQENYDYVKSMWPLANNQTRKLCLSHSSYAVDYQYVGLASCLQVYVPHQQLQEQGPFHY
jgi:hypothetical protein